MSELYDDDILLWSERQAELLRRRAAGTLVNDAEIDWSNVAEEIEDVGRSQVRAVLSAIENILRHRIYIVGWPSAPAARRWRAELRTFDRDLKSDYTSSMTTGGRKPVTDQSVQTIYADAVEYCRAHMEQEPEISLPAECPWTLEELRNEPF